MSCRCRVATRPARARSTSRGPDARAEPEGESFAQRTIAVLVVFLDNDHAGTEELLGAEAGARAARRGAPWARGTSPAGWSRAAATARDRRAVLDRIRDEALEPGALLLARRAARARRRDPPRGRSGAAPARAVSRSTNVVVQPGRARRSARSRRTPDRSCERPPQRALDGAVEIGVVEDEHRVLPAKLEHRRAEPLGGGLRDGSPDLGGSREDDAADPAMADEGVADGLAGALDDADEARRGPGASEELLDPEARLAASARTASGRRRCRRRLRRPRGEAVARAGSSRAR